MRSQNNRLRLIIIIGLIALIILIIALGFVFRRSSNDETYYDKGSGETVSSPADKSPETDGGAEVNTDPLYLGFSALAAYGVSDYQLDGIKKAFNKYSNEKEKLSEVSFDINKIKQTQRDYSDDNSRDYLTIPTTFNRGFTYTVKIEYFDITDIQVYIYDKSGANIAFDSGVISTTVDSTGDDHDN